MEWCFGCPLRIGIEREGGQTTVVCDPGSVDWCSRDPGPLRDMADVITSL